MSTSARTSSPVSASTNRWSTKQLVTMALMCAISIVLSFIEFSIFPSAAFLKLDISLVPAAVVGFAYGPVSGVVVGLVCALAHAVISGNWVGAIMNTIMTLAIVVPSAAIYKKFRTFKGAIVSLVVGAVVMVALAGPANILVDPLYGIPAEAVIEYMPIIIAFNVIKAVVIAALTGIVYKAISNLITPEKDRVKGR